MKRILIVNNNMHIGGVQKALLDLLNEIHKDHDITLLLFYNGGGLMKSVPADVRVISPAAPFKYWGMTKKDAATFGSRAARAFFAAMTRVFGRGAALRLAYPFQKKLCGYDVAISFLHSGAPDTFYGGCNEFVLDRVEAEKKITFLHCDYERIGAASEYNAGIYRRFDMIAACSEGCREAFLRVMPELAAKTTVVPNCHDYAKIRSMAEREPETAAKDRLNIVTVARFGKEKGILRAVRAVAELGERGKEVCYRIIGDGAEYSEAAALVKSAGLEDTVFLLGERENPYGYMKAADLLLIPSVSEAAPMVIGEAASLGTPVLTTETSSAREMVLETGYGWVCENSTDGIRRGIEMLLSDPRLIRERKEHLRTLKPDNAAAIKSFSELVR